ncbi:MAG: aspartate 1-decarboxylase [Cardiobacteriaceae bacterium]|nr:aspartate 1-decarboxylase [Cardiobacteriaceae bacterium]
MFIEVLKGKIHRATVTEANLNYVGSITIDETLMEAAGMREYEKVQVVDIDNGARLETYIIKGARNSGVICLNGAAARLVQVGDKVIIMAYAFIDNNEYIEPKIVVVNAENKVQNTANSEKEKERYQ